MTVAWKPEPSYQWVQYRGQQYWHPVVFYTEPAEPPVFTHGQLYVASLRTGDPDAHPYANCTKCYLTFHSE